MPVFRVWAPRAERVDLVIANRDLPMARGEGGWWEAETDHAGEVEYQFRVDGAEKPLPDPRSPWQPRGVHGPSRTIDHAAFPWTDAEFRPTPLSAAVIYEVHVGTFSRAGTFEGVVAQLDHLRDVGVTHIELMPVAEYDGLRGWGYDGVHIFAPEHAYGGPVGLKRLVDACHNAGVGVILDVVYNHLGPVGNYLGVFAPYFTSRHCTPWGQAVNLDGPQCDEVRRYFCDNAKQWFRDYHIDGLRLDAVHTMIDISAYPFLEQLAAETEDLEAHLGRQLALIAESDLNDPRLVRSREQCGMGLQAQWSDDFCHAVETVLSGDRSGINGDFGTIEQLATAFRQPFVYDGGYSKYRQRLHGRSAAGLPGHRFIAFAQNHDQVGNQMTGTRLAQRVGPDRAKIAAALVFMSPYVPLLFQGEEWMASTPFQYFVDFDQELNAAVFAGRKREFAAFGWDPSAVPVPYDEQTFLRSKLNWDEVHRSPHAAVLDWYRTLARLRRSIPELTDGHLHLVRTQFDEQARWLVVERGSITMACNLGPRGQRINFESSRPAVILAASKEGYDAGALGVYLPPDSIIILGVEPAPAADSSADGPA